MNLHHVQIGLIVAGVAGSHIAAWVWFALTGELTPVALWFLVALLASAAGGDVGEDC